MPLMVKGTTALINFTLFSADKDCFYGSTGLTASCPKRQRYEHYRYIDIPEYYILQQRL